MEKDVFATSIQEAMKDMTFSNTKDGIINHLRDTCDERGRRVSNCSLSVKDSNIADSRRH